MKKELVCLACSAVSILFFSCQTTKTVETYEKNTIATEEQSSQQEPVKTEAEIFSEKINGLKLIVESSPELTTKGTAFSKPFIVKVTNADGTPAAMFPISVLCPSSSDEGILSYTETSVLTDETGTISFIPETPTFSCNTTISFYPDAKTLDTETLTVAKSYAIEAPFTVRTNLRRSGGIIGLRDFNARGVSLTDTFSSSLLLKELMNNGFVSVGNFDIPVKLIEDTSLVYKDVHDKVGNSVAYLIYGTIKYASPIEKVENDYVCTLEGIITCLEMKTGKILYKTTKTVTVKDASDWKVINIAREAMAKEISQAVIYGM